MDALLGLPVRIVAGLLVTAASAALSIRLAVAFALLRADAALRLVRGQRERSWSQLLALPPQHAPADIDGRVVAALAIAGSVAVTGGLVSTIAGASGLPLRRAGAVALGAGITVLLLTGGYLWIAVRF